ncbi:MAG: RsmB/NOP family class I SAM-dependent RNA methyltransferase [Planctomycetota bacterium]
MSSFGTRSAALRLLVHWDETYGAHIDELLHAYFANCELEPRDRGLVAELCYGNVRHRNTLRAVSQALAHRSLDRSPRSIRIALALGLYQRMYLETPPHAVCDTTVAAWEQCFAGEHPAPMRSRLRGFLNATLRRGCDEFSFHPDSPEQLEDPRSIYGTEHWVQVPQLKLPSRHQNLPEMLGVKFSHPPDVLRLWLGRFDEPRLLEMLRWNNRPPATTIVLRSGVSPQNYVRRLSVVGIELEGTHDPAAFRVRRVGDIANLPGYGAGEFWVQDGTARALALMLPRREHATMLDLCAAPGGKLATYLDRAPTTQVLACDVNRARLDTLRENLERLKLFDHRRVELKEIGDDPERLRLGRDFDQVTVDAPCSNTGVLSRRHEARWRILPENLRALQQKQLKLLRAAAGHVAPAGQLLYTTCSIEPIENAQVVQSVLQSHPELRLVEEREVLPGDDGGDGGYGALLQRR